jgi:two-component system, OmpR family, sensor histidine kinase KdpD
MMSALSRWDRPPGRVVAETSGEIVLAVAAATVVVALLQSASPAAGLGVVYLPAVLEVAVRRGQWAGLATAVLGVLTLNYLFIAPRHQLAIRHTQDLIALIVFLMAAVVVGRLAELGRARAREAESRARLAAAREQEATLLAEAASAILARHTGHAQLAAIEKLVRTATGATGARIVAEPVPSPQDGEVTVRLRAQQRTWLYVTDDGSWSASQLERVAEPLGKLLDVAAERERVAEQAAETEAARRTETARTAVLHAISHDLRSPLTAITTAISALRSDLLSADEHGELIDMIDGESVRLAKLVDDLLDLSKIQAGAVAPRPDWCDLSDVVASAVAHLPDSQPIELDLPFDLPLVQADAAQLERVFSNLLENAIKFSPAGAPVRVTGGAAGGRVTVRVTDRGRGIPAAQRTRVFEPFFRGRTDRSPVAAGAGSGLGLAIVKGFVEANGGRILLQSGTDQGTSFAVSFPMARQPAPAGS